MRALHARRRDTIMAAYEAGVAIYAGTDAGGVLPHGHIAGEVRELADYGITPVDALGAASWRARAWLGLDGAARRGHRRRLRRLRPRPARRPVGAGRARGASCCVAGSSAESLPSSAHPDPEVVAVLRAAGCVFAEDEAARPPGRRPPTQSDLALMLARRVAGEPLEQVVGWAEFCGLRITVAPGVFVPAPAHRGPRRPRGPRSCATPRPHARPSSWTSAAGSGAIGVAIADRLDDVELHAADLDPDAVACARQNVTAGEVHEGDLYDALPRDLRRPGRRTRRERAVRAHRRDPADAPRSAAPRAPRGPGRGSRRPGPASSGGSRGARWLAPGGSLLIETSPRQATDTAHFCIEAGLEVQIFGGDPVRVIRAISAGSGSSGTMAR